MSPRDHIAEMRRALNAPPPAARFWDEASQGERRYMLMSAEHTEHRIGPDSRKTWAQLDEKGRNAASRAHRKVIDWAESIADRGAVVDL